MSDNQDGKPEATENTPPIEQRETQKMEAPEKPDGNASAPESPSASVDLSKRETPGREADASGQTDSAAREANESEKEDLGALNGFFNGCARVAPVMLLVFLCVAVWPEFWRGDGNLFCPPESATISAYLRCVSQNSWLAPLALENGAWLAPQWPGVYWLAYLLGEIPGFDTSLILACTGAVNAAILLLAIWALSEAARFGYRASFAAALIAFCSPLIVPSAHFVGSGALAAGVAILSIACFARGWLARRAILSLPCGFALCALAGLCGGLLFMAVPLAASFVFLLWRADARRAQSIDAILGFVLFLAIWGVWLGLLALRGEADGYIASLFGLHWNLAWPPHPRWWAPLVIALVGTSPWTMEIFGVSWFRVLARSGKSLAASRRDNGSAMIWISLVLAGCAAVFMTQPQWAALFLHGLLAVLLGKAFVNLSAAGNRFFFFLAGVLLCLAGLALLAMSFGFSQELFLSILPAKLPAFVPGLFLSLSSLPIIAGLLLLGGIITFWFVRKNRGAGGLVYAVFLVLVLAQPAMLLLTPELAASPDTRLVTLAQITEKVAQTPMALSPREAIQTPAVANPVAPAPVEPVVPEPTTPSAPAPAVPEIETPAAPTLPDAAELEKVTKPETPAVQVPDEPSPDKTPTRETPATPKAPGADNSASPETSAPATPPVSEGSSQSAAPGEDAPVKAPAEVVEEIIITETVPEAPPAVEGAAPAEAPATAPETP